MVNPHRSRDKYIMERSETVRMTDIVLRNILRYSPAPFERMIMRLRVRHSRAHNVSNNSI
ncbi:hypothetical protein PRJ_Fausto_00207 [Faustovirus]|nr:hypothetical protein PRJ_Fausto_00207 [Faustovirus]